MSEEEAIKWRWMSEWCRARHLNPLDAKSREKAYVAFEKNNETEISKVEPKKRISDLEVAGYMKAIEDVTNLIDKLKNKISKNFSSKNKQKLV
jgi:hypothetical protein